MSEEKRPGKGGERRATDAQEIVQLMAELVADSGGSLERRWGLDATAQAQQMQAALMERLEGNLGHVVLWEQFVQTPGAVAPALVGVVQSLLEGDPALGAWLGATLEAHRGALRSPGTGREE
jgi:hypothetical protein